MDYQTYSCENNRSIKEIFIYDKLRSTLLISNLFGEKLGLILNEPLILIGDVVENNSQKGDYKLKQPLISENLPEICSIFDINLDDKFIIANKDLFKKYFVQLQNNVNENKKYSLMQIIKNK
jgi:hypothetical protein